MGGYKYMKMLEVDSKLVTPVPVRTMYNVQRTETWGCSKSGDNTQKYNAQRRDMQLCRRNRIGPRSVRCAGRADGLEVTAANRVGVGLAPDSSWRAQQPLALALPGNSGAKRRSACACWSQIPPPAVSVSVPVSVSAAEAFGAPRVCLFWTWLLFWYSQHYYYAPGCVVPQP
jgi:hypothetical protein